MKTSIIALSIATISATGALAQNATSEVGAEAAAEVQAQSGEILFAQARTEAQVVAALELQGYEISAIRHSLLGRVVVTAQNQVHVRQVVMSRGTGEILSDQIVDLIAGADAQTSGTAAAGADGGSTSTGATVGLGVDLGVSAGSNEEDEGGGSTGASVGGSGGVSIGLGN